MHNDFGDLLTRRAWLRTAGGLLALAALPRAGIAAPTHEVIDPPIASPSDVIEVLEFFHYGCPHCRNFDPLLQTWKAKLPGDVRVRAVPVIWNQRVLQGLATFHFALAAIGALDTLHPRVFAALQDERRPLYDRDGAAEWVREQGADGAALAKAWDSFGVQTRVKQADRETREYQIQGVPTLAIAGRYRTSASLTGSHEAALAEADRLIALVRQNRQKG
jgi:thiol:disulfide interchange protein DsbA